MTERQIIERLKKIRKSNGNIEQVTQTQLDKRVELKKKWMTYFRNNIEIYIEKRMGFHGYGYQNFSYHIMDKSDQYIEVSTRGTGKSLRCVCYACARALLYPNSKIGLTAVGSSQANENYLTAFMQELVLHPYSPFLNWLYNNGLITSRETDKGYNITFWNGSVIYFFPTINSARGLHFDTLIGEEVRLIKKADWDSIAMPMLVKRQAGYRNQPKYYERIDLDEPTKVICITSNRFKNEWFNTMYKNTTVGYFKETYTTNGVFSVDIFSAIKHGLKDESWYLKQEKEMDELSFKMEILNETVGEVEGAYFTLEMFNKNQKLTSPFYPITPNQYVNGTQHKFRNKKDEEIRLLFIDFAFVGGDGNDNTVIGCMSAYPKSDVWIRNVDYITTKDGGMGDEALLSIREIYWDYEADYIVFDIRNGGEVHYNALTKPFEHPYRRYSDWNNHGFTVCSDKNIQMISGEKMNNLINRTNDKEAIPCLIPINASNGFNSVMWQELNHKLKKEELVFLVDLLDYQQKVGVEELNMTSEERVEMQLPYVQTRLLINEAVNLTASFRTNGEVSLSEGTNPNATKDRIVSLGYGNYIMTKIINQLNISKQQQEIDVSEYQLIF